MAEQVSAAHDSESEEFLDESPFRSSLRTVLLVDLAALSVWTAWVHPGFNGLSRLALVGVWSVPALWSLATRPLLRTLALRRMRRRSRESLFVVTCVLVVTALLTLSTTLADSIGRSARSAVDRRFGSIDEMVLAATPEARLDAQNRLDQTLNARSDTVNDLSLLVQGQLGFVVAEMVLRRAASCTTNRVTSRASSLSRRGGSPTASRNTRAARS